MGEIFAVMSGKGGVGKSTVAANTAACFEKSGKKVLLFDADLCLRNLDIILGLTDSTVWDIEDVFKGRCAFEDAVLSAGKHKNLFLLKAPAVPVNDTEKITDFIVETALSNKDSYDFIIIDCPSGLNAEIRKFMRRGIGTILVTTPDFTAISDASRTAEAAYKAGAGDVKLIINRINALMIKKDFAPNFDEIIDGTHTQLLGLIPDDPRIGAYANRGILVSDLRKSFSKKAFENISNRLLNIDTELYEFWK